MEQGWLSCLPVSQWTPSPLTQPGQGQLPLAFTPAAGSLFYLGYLALKSSTYLPLNLHHLNSSLNSIFTVRFHLTAEHLFPFVLEIHYQNQTCTYTLAHSQYNHLHGGLHWLIKSTSESISIDKAHLGCRFKTDNKGQESFNNCHLTR